MSHMPNSSAPSHSRLAFLSVALVLALGAAPAAAHTTTVSGSFEVRVSNEPASQDAGNIISVSEDAAGNLLVEDSGAGVDVVAGSGCSQQTDNRVSCPPNPNNNSQLDIFTGQGNDQIAIDLPTRPNSGVAGTEVAGGPGNDRIFGGPGQETLDGDGRLGNGSVYTHNINEPLQQDGNDVIFGGAGPDTLLGRDGRDYLNGALPGESGTETSANTLNGGPKSDFFDAGNSLGPDRFTGGSGEDAPVGETNSAANTGFGGATLQNGEQARVTGGDTVSYGPRTFPQAGTAGVTADLDGVADDGATGEGDQIDADVEALVGSIRNDSLTGSGAVNRIEGRLGTDTLQGLGGADRMLFRDGVADTCFVAGTGDFVDLDLTDPTGCVSLRTLLTATVGSKPVDETIPYVKIGSRLRKRAGRAIARVKCDRTATRTCTGTIALSRALRGRALARRRFRVRPGRTARVRFRLPPSKEAALKRLGRAALTTVSQGTSSIGPTSTFAARRF
jgi:RTX calcium-binding nonapeptide repeat (4 copies)